MILGTLGATARTLKELFVAHVDYEEAISVEKEQSSLTL